MTELKEPLKNLKEFENAALACAQCGQCRAANWPSKGIFHSCPVTKVDGIAKFEPLLARGKNLIMKGLLWGHLQLSQEISDVIYQCTLCGLCEEVCFNSQSESFDFPLHNIMDHVNTYEALRADLVEAGFPIESQVPMNKAMVELLNPYERDNKEKVNWTQKLDFKIKNANTEDSEILYFVGCTSGLTPDIEKVAIATAKIFNKLGVDFSVFGEHEVCCGSVGMRTGDRNSFGKVAEKNAELFKGKGIKRIVTSCAGCYRTFKKDYGNRLEDIEILHTVEFLQEIIKIKDIKLKNLDIKTTYHDPCHLGRHMNVYEAPRDLLNMISNLTEMKTNRVGAMCCGAGGGVKKGFPELSMEIAKNRVKEAEDTGAEYLVSTCPFCWRNLNDAIVSTGSNLKMVDLVEL
ncbi:MAG TPA: (Fe-S)-binding protein, partial [Maribacter sp.]|nr:(Fe-S)-binding protein [Maribacter sp.]